MTTVPGGFTPRLAASREPGTPVKPRVEDLGVDVEAQRWRRSGSGPGAIEVAFVEALGRRWVLMRTAGEPSGLVLVYDRHEWECFVDGAKRGEFDDAAAD
jgi:Domain of unknown function (DUF397)